MKTIAMVLMLAGALGLLGGCGIPEWWLGAHQGVLFQGLDGLAYPGEPAEVWVSLRAGRLLRGMSDYTVFFYRGTERIGAAKTDEQGLASIEHAFAEPGVYSLTATLDPAELGTTDVPVTEVVVGVYPPAQRLMLVDLDKTLVASGFDLVLLGRPEPMPHAVQAMHELAQTHQVVYLTQRPDYLVTRSRRWLQRHDLPRGPLLVSALEGSTFDNEAYKAGRIERIVERFPHVELGVGDKLSDALAYRAHGVQALLIVHTQNLTPGQIRERAAEIETLPPGVEVVSDWREVLAVVRAGQTFPPDRMAARLREIAAEQERQIERELQRPGLEQPPRSQEVQP